MTTAIALLVVVSCLPNANQIRGLPGVVKVEATAVEAPSHRVIHLLNWHWIPEDRYQLDNPEGDYRKFLDEVDAVQQEQMTLLRAMKVRVVFYEGLTAENRFRRQQPSS